MFMFLRRTNVCYVHNIYHIWVAENTLDTIGTKSTLLHVTSLGLFPPSARLVKNWKARDQNNMKISPH